MMASDWGCPGPARLCPASVPGLARRGLAKVQDGFSALPRSSSSSSCSSCNCSTHHMPLAPNLRHFKALDSLCVKVDFALSSTQTCSAVRRSKPEALEVPQLQQQQQRQGQQTAKATRDTTTKDTEYVQPYVVGVATAHRMR